MENGLQHGCPFLDAAGEANVLHQALGAADEHRRHLQLGTVDLRTTTRAQRLVQLCGTPPSIASRSRVQERCRRATSVCNISCASRTSLLWYLVPAACVIAASMSELSCAAWRSRAWTLTCARTRAAPQQLVGTAGAYLFPPPDCCASRAVRLSENSASSVRGNRVCWAPRSAIWNGATPRAVTTLCTTVSNFVGPGAPRRWLRVSVLDHLQVRPRTGCHGLLKLAQELHGALDTAVVSENSISFTSLSTFFSSSNRRCPMARAIAVCANSAPGCRAMALVGKSTSIRTSSVVVLPERQRVRLAQFRLLASRPARAAALLPPARDTRQSTG